MHRAPQLLQDQDDVVHKIERFHFYVQGHFYLYLQGSNKHQAWTGISNIWRLP